jgi:hypothetical protein
MVKAVTGLQPDVITNTHTQAELGRLSHVTVSVIRATQPVAFPVNSGAGHGPRSQDFEL